MERNIFDVSPVELANQDAKRRTRGVLDSMGDPKAKPPQTFEDVARKHQVPQNVIETVVEETGIGDPREQLRFADEFADRIGRELKSGKAMPDAMRSVFGDEAPVDEVLQKAIDRVKPNGAPAASDPFENESLAETAKRRGQQFARGATETVASLPEATALTSARVEQREAEDAGEFRDERAKTIAMMQERLNEPDLDPKVRGHIERTLADMQIGQEELQRRSDAEVVPPRERDIYKAGDTIRDASEGFFGKPDERDKTFWAKLAEGGGNMTGMAITALAANVFGGPAAALATGAAQGSAMNQSQVYKEAIEAGADEETAQQAAQWGSAIGASEIIPITRALKIVPKKMRNKVTNRVLRRFGHIAESAGEEAAQEFLATVANNIVASEIYDPDRGWTEGAGEAALIGGILGGVMGGAGAVMARDGGAEPPAPPAEAPEAPEGQPGAEPPEFVPDPVADLDQDGFGPDQPVPMAPGTPMEPGEAIPAEEDLLTAPPQGPLSRAAQSAGPAPAEPQPFLPRVPKGARVNVDIPGGTPIEAEFVDESDEGVTLKVDGNPITITREELESGEVNLQAVDELSGARPEAVFPDTTPKDPTIGQGFAPGQRPEGQGGKKNPPRLMKRPFTNQLAATVDGIDPESRIGKELAARDITPSTVPGLFRRGGATSLDNLAADEWAGLRYDIGVSEDGTYLDEQGILDAIEREHMGQPVQDEQQQALQDRADTRALMDEARERGWDIDEPEAAPFDIEPGSFILPTRETDISTDAERMAMAESGIRFVEEDIGATLTPDERREAITNLTTNGGSVEDAVWSILEREVETDGQTQTSADTNPAPPLHEQDVPAEGRGEGPLESRDDDAEPAVDAGRGAESAPEPETPEIRGKQAPADRLGLAKRQEAPQGIQATAEAEVAQGTATDEAPAAQAEWWKALPRARHAAKQVGYDRESVGDSAWSDLPRLVATVNERIRAMGYDDLLAPEDAEVAPATEQLQNAPQNIPENIPVEKRPDRPSSAAGYSFKLADRLSGRDNKTIAKFRDSAAGEIISEIDGIARRAEAAMRKKGADSRNFDDAGRSEGGNASQEATIIAEARYHANQLAEAMRKAKSGDLAYPARDEDTGEFENDGSPMGEALEFIANDPEAKKRIPEDVKTEQTPEGEQTLIPGLEPITDKDRAEVQAKKPKRGGDAPLPEGGLFDDGARNQPDMFDAPAAETSSIETAAAETDPNPTLAQAEAENYKTGKTQWNGLTLSIENAKGSTRRGTDAGGNEWSVTMPAHYGRILRTEGADGDHVDFYMGEMPDSDAVFIVNQIDPETGTFDEHKVVLGTGSQAQAERLYEGGFSDGSGKDRKGPVTATNVEGFKAWLKEADLKKPTEPIQAKAQPDKTSDDDLDAMFDELESTLESEAEADQKARKGEVKEKRARITGEPAPREDGQPKPETMKAIVAAVNALIEAFGLEGKVTARAWRKIEHGPLKLDGFYTNGRIHVSAASQDSTIDVARHEVVHALRDPDLWGAPYGVFTKAEWQGLVRAARRNKRVMEAARRDYSDRPEHEQIEEAIAEKFREWMAGRDVESEIVRALRKIKDALNALANALTGAGFQSAGRTFERMASGELGRRGPKRDVKGRFVKDDGGSKTAPKFSISKTVRDKIAAIWNGANLDAPVVLGRLPKVFRALTGKDNTLVISGAVVRKAGNHGLSETDVVAAIEGLGDPVMVFDSRNAPGNFTVLVAHETTSGRSSVVGIDVAFKAGRLEVSRVATIHGKDSDRGILALMRDGYLRYINKRKADEWRRSRGLQLPKDGTTTHRPHTKILQYSDVFKDDGFDPNNPSIRAKRQPRFHTAPSVTARSVAEGSKELTENALTRAMNGSGGTNLLALVPGRALLSELGAKLPGAQKYLRLKEQMDALRNEKHGKTDALAQEWRKLTKDADTNTELMDLMHDSTIAGIDPSQPYKTKKEPRDAHLVRVYAPHTMTHEEAKRRIEEDAAAQVEYGELRARFRALPAEYQVMYVRVRNAYTQLADEFEVAVSENAEKAMTIGLRRAERHHAKEMERIRDEGLTGDEKKAAIEQADADLKTAAMKRKWTKNARMKQLRQRFESNRLEGPYFPLARFGDFFVTVRDAEGKVIGFSRFEKVKEQKAFASDMRAEGHAVEVGVMQEMNARDTVDPGFVADVESLLEEIDADESVMDTIWQRWLHTLPDMSVRKSRIHRKGTPGYNSDAFRAFGYHMFHGAHQLARLKYSLDMQEQLELAEQEARQANDPVRAGLVVKEMKRRHEYVMNPSGKWWSQAATSAAFVYYLSVTPAAAIVNLTQTSVVGTAVLGAFHGKGGTRVAAKELSKAMSDFTRGRGHAADSKRLTRDERQAMKDAYDRGTVDKSQAHDLAGVGETGVEYSAVRTKVMGAISWFFHHAERANREVTFLAAYRMAKAKGLPYSKAVEKAADLTWKSHFDYQNTSRPRLMQDDYVRVALVFRNFQINMLWRLFRDVHQTFNGESKAAKDEARRQLVGITSQMLLHAGIKGVWGYSLLMTLLAAFSPEHEDKEDLEKDLEKAVVALLPRDAAGMLLNGVPGHLLGIDLRARVGMPDLWFRSSDRDLEGSDEYQYWVAQFLGAFPAMFENAFRGAQYMGEGNWWRGTETMAPKFIRDQMRAARYADQGAKTFRGNPIIEEFGWGEIIAQALGFTPARLSEQYDHNRRLKNEEQRIVGRRSDLQGKASSAALEGRGIPDDLMEEIKDFNEDHPEYPITGKTFRQSLKGKQRARQRNEGGVQLNPKLNRRLRDDAAPLLYE